MSAYDVAQVTTTLLAARDLARRPRLFSKVRHVLAGVLETALEMQRLQQGFFPQGPPLTTKVDGHLVYYSLDLDRQCATILAVESPPEIA